MLSTDGPGYRLTLLNASSNSRTWAISGPIAPFCNADTTPYVGIANGPAAASSQMAMQLAFRRLCMRIPLLQYPSNVLIDRVIDTRPGTWRRAIPAAASRDIAPPGQ